MGLDMFAFKVKKGTITEAVDFEVPQDVEPEEVQYWRKHPNLHGWMQDLYYEKNGTGESFNCDNVQLTEEDIDMLEADINGDNLPETRGFFFGESSPEDKEQDLEFVKKAREVLVDHDLYYTSWW